MMEKNKLFSDKEKSNTETYLLKMVDEIKKLQIPLKWGRLGHHRSQRRAKLSFKQCKNCEFITEDTCILEEHELINHQKNEKIENFEKKNSIYSDQAESEREANVPINIETSPPEEMGNNQQLSTRPSSPVDSKFPICLFFFHKSMLRKQETKRKFNIDEDENEENLKFPKKKKKSNPKKSVSP